MVLTGAEKLLSKSLFPSMEQQARGRHLQPGMRAAGKSPVEEVTMKCSFLFFTDILPQTHGPTGSLLNPITFVHQARGPEEGYFVH